MLKTDARFDLSFSEVKIRRYNRTGYCAPKDVFSREDYDHDGAWDSDYVSGLHLVEDSNDAEEKTQNFRFADKWTDTDGNRYEKWTAYLPEYRNIGAATNTRTSKSGSTPRAGEDEPQ